MFEKPAKNIGGKLLKAVKKLFAFAANGEFLLTGVLRPAALLFFAFTCLMPVSSYAASTGSVVISITIDPFPPAKITNLSAAMGSQVGDIDLSWMAPGEDGNKRQLPAGAYLIKYDTQPVSDFADDTTSWWDAAENIYSDIGWLPNSPGMQDTVTIQALSEGVTYYFAVRSKDLRNNWSAISNVSAAVSRWDSVAPAAVTSLYATAGANEGGIDLSWIAPGDDGTTGNLTGKFRIDYATYTKAWSYDSYKLEISTVNSPPLASYSHKFAGLSPGVTYYFRAWTADEWPNWSGISNGATAYAQLDFVPPAAVSDLAAQGVANEVKLTWTAPGDDGTTGNLNGRFSIFYSTDSNMNTPSLIELSTSAVPGIVQTYTVTGLNGGTSYYFVMRTSDERNNVSADSNKATAWTFNTVAPAAPAGLTALAGDSYVALSWNANTESDFARYRVYRSTDSTSWTLYASTTEITFTDTGVVNYTTYWYYLTAVDNYSNESSSSNAVYAQPFIIDNIKPAVPAGIYGALASQSAFVLHWSSVVYNADGSVCTDLEGYNIYRATGVWGPFVLISTASAQSEEISIARSTETAFYAVTSRDLINESGKSLYADSSDELNDWVVCDSALVRIPSSIGAILRTGSDTDLVISTASRVALDEDYPAGRILRSYDFEVRKNVSGEKVNVSFDKPEAEIRIYYTVGSGGTIQSLDVKEAAATDSLALVWFNGTEWLKLGGEVDTADRCVKIYTSRLGKYQLRISPRSTKFNVLTGPIPKIFTPNGDGMNDSCMFTYDNPSGVEPTGEVFDIRGRKVADLSKGASASASSGSLVWDGKVSSGGYAAPGVYIWQIKAQGKVFNGTVVVAR